MLISNKKLFTLNQTQKRRIIKNIFSGFSTESLQIITQIIFAPLMLFFWGVENFGIWLFLLSIPNIFLVFNINTLDAAIQEITMFKSKGNIKKANEIFQNSIILVFLNIFIVTILIVLFYFFYQADFSIIKNIKAQELSIIFTLLIASIYINLFEGILISGIYSEGKLHIGFNIASVVDLLSKVSIALSGIIFESLLYPAIIFFLFNVAKFLINYYFFTITVKNLFFSFKLISKKILKKIIKLSIGHTADTVSNIIKHSGIILILGIFYDPYIIGYIATAKTLFYFLPIRFFGKLSHITLYEYASLFSKKKFLIIKKNIIGVTKIIFIILTLFILLAIIIGPFIYNFWLNNKYELGLLLLLLILFDAFFFILRDSITSVLRAINKFILLGISELIIVLIIILLFYLTLYFGYSYLVGFLILLFGSLISLLCAISILIFFIKKLNKK